MSYSRAAFLASDKLLETDIWVETSYTNGFVIIVNYECVITYYASVGMRIKVSVIFTNCYVTNGHFDGHIGRDILYHFVVNSASVCLISPLVSRY